jgi:hypothetical protein
MTVSINRIRMTIIQDNIALPFLMAMKYDAGVENEEKKKNLIKIFFDIFDLKGNLFFILKN